MIAVSRSVDDAASVGDAAGGVRRTKAAANRFILCSAPLGAQILRLRRMRHGLRAGTTDSRRRLPPDGAGWMPRSVVRSQASERVPRPPRLSPQARARGLGQQIQAYA